RTQADDRRVVPLGGGLWLVAGPFALHVLAGLSAAAAGNYHGRVLRAGTEFCDSQHYGEGRCNRRKYPGFEYMVGESDDWRRLGWLGGRVSGARRSIRAECNFVSAIGVANSWHAI